MTGSDASGPISNKRKLLKSHTLNYPKSGSQIHPFVYRDSTSSRHIRFIWRGHNSSGSWLDWSMQILYRTKRYPLTLKFNEKLGSEGSPNWSNFGAFCPRASIPTKSFRLWRTKRHYTSRILRFTQHPWPTRTGKGGRRYKVHHHQTWSV